MQELRFVAVSEDGRYAVLAVPGRSARFTLPIDERLRAVALGQSSRLVQYEIEVESPLRPKEIQARIRAGETVEEIADAAGIAVERVRWFEGPVLAERAYVAAQAQAASVRRQGDATPSTPGHRLGEIVAERMKVFGADPEDAQWDAKKRGDGNWQVQLAFVSGDRRHVAAWTFDPRRRHVLPADENAARMSLPGGEPPQPAAPPPGEATVTRLAPRLSAASGQGFGPSAPAAPLAASAASRFDPRGEIPHPPASGRHSAPERQIAEPRVPETASSDPEAPAPAAAAPFASRNAPVTPATAAAQVPKAAQPAQRTQAQRSQEPRTAQGRPEAAVPAARSETRAGETAARPASAEDSHLSPAASADPASDPTGRQGRKAARGKRSSVPSWDEIMFGNNRQRD